jgi:hypothetical protein
MTGRGADMLIENLADCPMFVNGVETKSAVVRPGDTVSLRLMDFLVRHELRGNARELDILLAAALKNSPDDRIEMLPEGSPELAASPASVSQSSAPSASAPRSSVPPVRPRRALRGRRRLRPRGMCRVTNPR